MAERKIRIRAGAVAAEAALNDSKTADMLWAALPVEAEADTWGEEIYFSVPVSAPAENPKTVVDLGEIAYWPPGTAFCIFFGRTPASRGDEIRPASAVNPLGKIIGDSKVFLKVKDGEPVVIEKA
jgi:uncharacterized protein